MGSSVILPPPGQPVEGPDPHFVSGSQPNYVSFSLTNVAPPSPLYIQRDDVLQALWFSSVAGEAIIISGRYLLPPFPPGAAGPQPDTKGPALISQAPATVQPFALRFASTGVLTQQLSNIPLAEGYLLAVSATSTAAISRGQTWVEAILLRSPAQSTLHVQTLFADYCTQSYFPSWPNGRIIHPTESTGFRTLQTVTSPAAGADWTFTVPSNSRFKIISLNAVLATSAVAGNRQVQIEITNAGGSVVWVGAANANIPASTTANVSATGTAPLTPVITTDVYCLLPPDLFLEGTFIIKAVTAGILGGDQWSAIQMYVETYIDL